jgi:hypothetical protein
LGLPRSEAVSRVGGISPGHTLGHSCVRGRAALQIHAGPRKRESLPSDSLSQQNVFRVGVKGTESSIRRSRSQFVLTDEPAHHALRSEHWSVTRPPSPIRPRLRRPQLEAPMGPGPVVVDDICAKYMLEVEGHGNLRWCPQAASSYSWMSPPSTSRRRTRTHSEGGAGSRCGSGVLSARPRCGLASL